MIARKVAAVQRQNEFSHIYYHHIYIILSDLDFKKIEQLKKKKNGKFDKDFYSAVFGCLLLWMEFCIKLLD
ncbi:MAG: hypothetical protein ACI90V_011372 [Bacillariaceae sp.]|jgi:hypothetical protein